jgi:hypothetical protein
MKHKLLIGVFALIILIGGAFLLIKKTSGGAAALFGGINSICSPGEYKYATQWGTPGSGNGQFSNPTSITVDGSGNVYVAERNNNRVQKFTSTGGYLGEIGPGQLVYPSAVTTDPSGNIYVSSGGFYVKKFNTAGQYVTQWGSFGVGNSQFNQITGIASDVQGNIYVTDQSSGGNSLNNRVQKFTSTGQYVTQWGYYGSGPGQFNDMHGITIDSSNNVYVVETVNNRVQKFNSIGGYLTQWGTQGTGNGQFFGAQSIGHDSVGSVFVGDLNGHIQKFNSGGSYLTQWGTQGTGNGQFSIPIGIAVDSSGGVYVVDSNLNRVQKFVPCTQLSAQIVPLKLISGKVYNDRNVNGTFDGTDNKLAGVKVDLYQVGQTTPLQSVVTPSVPSTDPTAGTYSFNNLPDGAYYVMINNEANYSSITQPGLSSISILGHVRFYFITITNGQGVINKDFGVVPKTLS